MHRLPVWLIWLAWTTSRWQFVTLEYEADATVHVCIAGHLWRTMPPEDFIGWGHPLAPLFVRLFGEAQVVRDGDDN